MFLLSLSFSGILIVLTPGYVISTASFPVPGGVSGTIFCWLLGSRYLLFTMGKVSILTVMCLAVERWYCVLRPVQYKLHFTTRRLLCYIAAITVSICLMQINKFFEYKELGGKCVKQPGPYGKYGTRAIVIPYTLITFIIPTFVSWASFAHIWFRLKNPVVATNMSEQARSQQRLLLRMCALTSIMLTLCWLPSTIIYVLTPFGVTKIGSPLHKTGHILAMFNSCVNPCIYWLTNKEYRKGLVGLFKRGEAVAPA